MALIMEIMKTIANPIGELAVWLEETYQVEVSETIEKWYELTGMKISVNIEGEVTHEKVESLDVNLTDNPKTNKKIPKIKSKDVCMHIFSNGQKAGEQCTTKPKGGAQYCSAHRPKDSVKSAKKAPKKKDVKVDHIDSEFESSNEEVPKEPKEPKKIKEKKVTKKQKKSEDNSDDEVPQVAQKEDSDNEGLSEPETPVKPLLKKKVKKAQTKPSKKYYDTEEEILDKDLNLNSDDE